MNLKAGYPFSLIKNGLVAEYPKLGNNLSTEVVVLGGGISGALIAWHLAQQNIDTVVVDARSIGLGSTCASTSLLQYEIDVPLYKLIGKIGKDNAVNAYRLCLLALDKLSSIASKIGLPEFDKMQSLYMAASKKDIAGLYLEFEARKKFGFDVSWMKEDHLLNEKGVKGRAAILSANAAVTDAYLFTHALHADSQRKGVHVFDRTEVISIKHSTKGVLLTTKEGYEIQAAKLVYATGYEVNRYLPGPIVDLYSTYATISENMEASNPLLDHKMVIWNTAQPYLYMRSMGDRIIVGGRDEHFTAAYKRDALLKSKAKKLIKDFNKVIPDINFIPEFTWTGTFGSTKDGLPYIGSNKDQPNSFFSLGFGGNGITFSLIGAEIITDLIKNRNNDSAGLFSFERRSVK